jgi:hypothetical protein
MHAAVKKYPADAQLTIFIVIPLKNVVDPKDLREFHRRHTFGAHNIAQTARPSRL